MWTGNYVKFFSSKYISSLVFFFNAFQAENYGFRFPNQFRDKKKKEKEKKGSGSVFHRVWDPET